MHHLDVKISMAPRANLDAFQGDCLSGNKADFVEENFLVRGHFHIKIDVREPFLRIF